MRNVKLGMDLFKSSEELKNVYREVVVNRYNALQKILMNKLEVLRNSTHQTRREITAERKETSKEELDATGNAAAHG